MQTRGIGTYSFTTGAVAYFNGKLTNFSPNSIVLAFTKDVAITDADMAKITCSIQFKNRLGKNAVIMNNVPVSVIAKMSDYEGGFSINSSDKKGAFKIPIGKIVLTGQDEISVSLAFASDCPTIAFECYAIDEVIGKETINIYEYAEGSSGQQLTFPNALVGYMAISNPSNSVNVRTSDYFDDNLITESEIVNNGAVLGQAEDFDDFGCFWADKSGYSQMLGVTCGSSNEQVLVREWFYDSNRIGVAQAETKSLETYAKEIRDTDVEKYRCLTYIFGM